MSLKVSERVFPRVHVYSEQYMCTVCTVPGGPEESHLQSVVCCGGWSRQECDDIRDTLLQIEITTETLSALLCIEIRLVITIGRETLSELRTR